MGSIVKREGARGVSYRARVKAGGRVRFKTFKRLTDARVWVSDTEHTLIHGGHAPTAADLKRTVPDLVDRYLEEVLPHKRYNRDQRNPARHLRWWRMRLNDLPLVDLSPDIIAKARDSLVRGKNARSPATANRYLAALSHACKVATSQWRWLRENPCRHVEKMAEPRGRTRFLSEDERSALLTACRADSNPGIYDVVLLALSTGMRYGEIRFLKWADVDLERKRVTLAVTKNDEVRVVPLTGAILPALEARSRVPRIDNPYVFPGRKRGAPADFSHTFARVATAAGLTDFHFHDLRHTAASHLAMNGASLPELAEILGHKTLQMVKRYAHLSEAHTASVLERMTARLGQ